KPSSEIDMWQVVSGTANLLSDCDLQAVVPTLVIHPHPGRRRRVVLPGGEPIEIPTTSKTAL
ncbi:MAG: hypothetical protein ACXVXZ_07890, partial [Mycobacteriaceae bacterium]